MKWQLTWKTLVAGWICLPPPCLLLRAPPIKDTSCVVVLMAPSCLAFTILHVKRHPVAPWSNVHLQLESSWRFSYEQPLDASAAEVRNDMDVRV